MSLRLRFGLTLASLFGFVIYIVGACYAIIWFNLNAEDQAALARIFVEHLSILVLFTFLLIAGLASILKRLFTIYFHAARLAEETQLIVTANANHRIRTAEVGETRQLADTINAFADRYQDLQQNVEARIRDASASLEREKDILAALMSELSQGVVVCNVEGQILLYNHQARQLLSPTAAPPASSNGNGNGSLSGSDGNGSLGGFIGLGRSIFGILDRNLIVHTLEGLHHRLEQGHANPVSHFITTTRQDQSIRVSMAPLQDSQNAITGFVLTVEDTTRLIEVSGRRDVLLQSLIERTRAGLANIRAAIETVLDYPDMERAQLNRFTMIIREESLSLGTQLERLITDSADYLRTRWPLEDMLSSDLAAMLQHKLVQRLGITARLDLIDESIWLKTDSYSLVQTLVYIVDKLREHAGVTEVSLRLQQVGRFAQFDIVWDGPPLDGERLRMWEQQPAITNGEGSPFTLHEVLERHEGEVWCHSDRTLGRAYVRILLPLTNPRPVWNAPVVAPSRPEFYDFDLFQQYGRQPELYQRRLTELTYTVFDTETTGLNPADGDEIIAIGAVRIVNGRLLQYESFDQLIDPRRPLSVESIQIHGILPAMLKGQPTIDQVLPLFARFAEDTVLVAHNAAFDMRFLQFKEARTGICFNQPVLDTLLLSAVVHPNQQDHSLETIAQMLGINIIGRHTALGDAIVTGEVFLKLVQLLAEQGIHTLEEARAAAQKTFYARLAY